MATIEENKKEWDGVYDWKAGGDEWSRSWGGADMQWYGTLLPRIHSFVPCVKIVEIACGHGRWTQYLKHFCESLTAVDLSEECVSACQKRFETEPHVSCHVTDGASLPMVDSRSADLVFSFDSLVHVDDNVMRAYIDEIARVLSDDGVAFIHHSNLAEIVRSESKVCRRVKRALRNRGIIKPEDFFWRDSRVDASLIEDHAASVELSCISQEIFPWAKSKKFIDCISVIVRKGSNLDRENQILRNPMMMQEAQSWARLSRLYSA